MSVGKRKKVSDLAFRMGLLNQWFHSWKGSLVILTFHRIGPERSARLDGGFSSDFDEGVYSCAAHEFRAVCRWLRSNAEVLSESDLLDTLSSGRSFPAGAAMITFDDGYIDNYTLAYPILKELGLPAIYFIPYDPIDQRELGWWDQISYLLKKTSKPLVRVDGQSFAVPQDRSSLIHILHDKMKLTPAAETQGFIQKLSRSCDVPLPSREEQSAELMSWDQIREVSRTCVAIGSHTCSHRVLATLSLDQQRLELTRSKALLEERIGRPVRTVAYPVGGYEHFHLDTLDLARQAGYRAGFSFCTGSNTSRIVHPFDIRRVSAPRSIEETAAMLRMPSVFGRRTCRLENPSAYPATAASCLTVEA